MTRCVVKASEEKSVGNDRGDLFHVSKDIAKRGILKGEDQP